MRTGSKVAAQSPAHALNPTVPMGMPEPSKTYTGDSSSASLAPATANMWEMVLPWSVKPRDWPSRIETHSCSPLPEGVT